MRIDTKQHGDVTVVSAHGRITIGQGDVALREAIESAVAADRKKILLDLDGVKRIDSSGIAEVVAAKMTVENADGVIKLANIPMKIQSVLGLTHVVNLFDVYESQEEALASFE